MWSCRAAVLTALCVCAAHMVSGQPALSEHPDRAGCDEIQLCAAASRGDLGVITNLLSTQGHPDHAVHLDALGRTPLMHAAFGGHLEATRALLYAGADANGIPGGGRDRTDPSVPTPLHAATLGGLVETVRLLLEHGADCTIGLQMGDAQITPLVDTAMAVSWGDDNAPEIMRLFVASKGNADLDTEVDTQFFLRGYTGDREAPPPTKMHLTSLLEFLAHEKVPLPNGKHVLAEGAMLAIDLIKGGGAAENASALGRQGHDGSDL